MRLAAFLSEEERQEAIKTYEQRRLRAVEEDVKRMIWELENL
jgi:hypothetical protein